MTVAQLDQALAVAPIATVQNRRHRPIPAIAPALACAERNIAYLASTPLRRVNGQLPDRKRSPPPSSVAFPRTA